MYFDVAERVGGAESDDQSAIVGEQTSLRCKGGEVTIANACEDDRIFLPEVLVECRGA